MDLIPLMGEDQCGENLGLAPARIDVRQVGHLAVDDNLANLVPEHLAQRHRCLPLKVVDNVLFLAMADPHDRCAIDDVRLITGYDIEPVPVDHQDLLAASQSTTLPVCSEQPILSPFPLQECSVEAHLSGPLASVAVTQRFANLLEVPMEAVYVFPLSAGAAVHAFRMTIGQRVVEGVVRSSGQARTTYQKGLRDGHRVALLEQNRDNVLSAQLGNLLPGEQVTIELRYVERLEQDLCESIFRFPLVVAPRHGAPAELAPVQRREHSARFRLDLTLDAGGATELACSQHAIVHRPEGDRLRLELARPDELLNRDFVLRYSFPAEQTRAALLTDDEHFLLTVQPPKTSAQPAVPRDVTFVIDRSASMQGRKWTSAVQATLDFLSTLDAHDSFRLITFNDHKEVFERGTLAQARAWLERRSPSGGTDIRAGLTEALAPAVPEGHEGCILLITDGQVSDEREICELVQSSLAQRRLFTLGIDTAVHAAFLQELARHGRGTCELVTPGEALEGALARLARETGSPVVTQIRLVDRGLNFLPEALNPQPVPDLFPSRPICLSGRKLGHGPLELAGRLANGEEWSVRVEPTRSENPALALVWARERIRQLQHVTSRAQEVERLALHYQLLSPYTSFVLVDKSVVANPGGESTRQLQPLAAPASWEPVSDDSTIKDISANDFGPVEYEDPGDEEIVLDKLRELVDEAPIRRVVNLIISQAINDGASHIHLEPQPKFMRVRYRVDGVLHEVMNPPKHIQAPLIARLKCLAGVDLAERARLQEGLLQVQHDGRDWDLRLAFIPTQAGEKVVIAIHSTAREALPPVLEVWLRRPGLVAIAGSAGLLRSSAHHLQQLDLTVGTPEIAPGTADLDAIVATRYDPALLEVPRGVFGAIGGDALTVLAGLHGLPAVWMRLTGVLAVKQVRKLCSGCRGQGCDRCKLTGFLGTLAMLETIQVTPELRQAASLSEILARSRVDTPFGEQARQALLRGETTDREVLRVLG